MYRKANIVQSKRIWQDGSGRMDNW